MEFAFWAVTHLLDERYALTEALALSEVSRLGPRSADLQAQLARNVKKLVEGVPLGELYRRACGGAPVVDSVSLRLDPAPGSLLWRPDLANATVHLDHSAEDGLRIQA